MKSSFMAEASSTKILYVDCDSLGSVCKKWCHGNDSRPVPTGLFRHMISGSGTNIG